MTDVLGVRKWEIEDKVTSSGTVIGDMPFGIPKTDEMRVQTFPELIEEFQKVPYYISTKMDGTSVTMYWKDGQFGIRGILWWRNPEKPPETETCTLEVIKRDTGTIIGHHVKIIDGFKDKIVESIYS